MTGGGNRAAADLVTLFLCGDVMTGRGIDQALPHPGDPRLRESYVTSALGYVELAETAHGPIPRPVDFAYVWGDALPELERVRPDCRIVNLETSVTRSEDCAPKGINYRMAPENVPCLAAAGIDCCVLANNHVLDWGPAGLLETLATLDRASIASAGAGRDLDWAAAPAELPLAGGGRVLVFAFGSVTSGIPADWAAGPARPGVNLLADLSPRTAARIAGEVAALRRPGDIVVASIHWGSNWGYRVPPAQRDFAQALIDDAGVDVVHGHSSHHPKAIEVHNDRPILYGCGDFLNDYEGIGGYAAFRGDLALMYFVVLAAATGRLVRLEMTPLRIRRFRLNRADRADAEWLRDTLTREGRAFGTRVELAESDRLTLAWG
ncbi:MAG: CapA family protein [Dongiaceae bacterium]